MVDIVVNLTKNLAPVNGLTDDPEITIRRLDTGAAVVSAAAMTDQSSDGLYTYSFTAVDGLNYSFLIDADPSVTSQVDNRYHNGSFNSDELLTRELAEADQFFDQSAGLLHYYRRGTTTDLIPAKSVTGEEVTADVTIQE